MDGLRASLCLVFTSGALACSLGAGCASDGGGASADPYSSPARTSQYEGDGYTRRYDDQPGTYAAPADDDREERQGPVVPNSARLAAEGRGDLSYKAKRDGYVYVVDRRDKKLIAQMPLDEGEELLIAPYRNVIEVDGKRVKRIKDLDNKHIHEIYFERDSDSGRSRKERDRDRKNR
jgi:hypothetical protein